ncbi:COP9 signalosome-like protein complex subunit 12 [Mollisia scopiformis]|uniref:COP9 signalosome-like protein complex subunit 12 n=1 Tax=Mollisia scopiformis TaxID=149040 RepID=A0A194X9A2_MOLSC|nr:COP9 signalosome-like protein complex subunit 12 [Mollisia scopiformis]KUJ16699.1 COP9 signalosome-like protein complex subunit 12 [Mollisia scopiformis]
MAFLDGYLADISQFLKTKDDEKLQNYLRVEPPLPDDFTQLSLELKKSWRDSSRLEKHVERLIPMSDDDKADEGGSWPGFLAFIQEYLEYWRDVNFDDLVRTHDQLSSLANSCITAMSNATLGIVLLPATIQLCTVLAKLATMLDKRPDLTSNLNTITDAEQGERKTLVEATAELIQRAFTICLTERTANRNGVSRDGKPEGKKVGIYSFANMVLKLLFQCRKTRLANQLFTNISANSPPLSLYPASHRVQFLYYLGRYHFNNNLFFYAQLCLQAAYDQLPRLATSHRRAILIYLIPANMILGRFPSGEFANRPEAADLLPIFMPVVAAIKKGNMVAFKHSLGPQLGNEKWLFHHGVLLPLLSRCEPLVWRSLARRVFLLTYTFPWDPTSNKAAVLNLSDMLAAAQLCQKLLEGWIRPIDNMTEMQNGRVHPNAMFMKRPSLAPPPEGRKKLSPKQGIIFCNKMPRMLDVESIVAGLVAQGFLHGFMSHAQGKFAIIGSKQKNGPLNAGFPSPWEVISARAKSEKRDEEVPGWIQKERKIGMGGVVNLSGIARPVGSGG